MNRSIACLTWCPLQNYYSWSNLHWSFYYLFSFAFMTSLKYTTIILMIKHHLLLCSLHKSFEFSNCFSYKLLQQSHSGWHWYWVQWDHISCIILPSKYSLIILVSHVCHTNPSIFNRKALHRPLRLPEIFRDFLQVYPDDAS